jgi:hypothetical protein
MDDVRYIDSMLDKVSVYNGQLESDKDGLPGVTQLTGSVASSIPIGDDARRRSYRFLLLAALPVVWMIPADHPRSGRLSRSPVV